ncbi:sigma-70 family RNA polymerase sigma factor [Paenibacillus mucilaginosus]|uniref:ECF family RNA polymerase sigma factor n=1 Tax=Paenibacillus mucilaginosus (strain KNP414) TaxID=1036673 RepID=F8F682_PAEMK|nr:sigma-70 family RNA polymerase sigma factor [Paenibacillus mucilaginosus]AEI42356.1 ECF family RNA polymerase sigma factor [Paenibacillus mucilaginosus KNP414]MCG7214311.1 sigma-70 family RNA polymerase sigma factor [Paenibacillus mucilaginosus]WDM28818.1 sigma-70 family RNA polymerase sigma factor [Paenibacillus mucilaginosus]
MDDPQWLTEHFETHRNHLKTVAYRMLGSLNEAEDAVQESWIRFSRTDSSKVENMGGWLTTIVSRVCLDMLRVRKSRREELTLARVPEPVNNQQDGSDPEQEALLADSVGLAMLMVLGNLNPAERIAFVLHDIFALSFSEIAPIIGRNEVAARQLASRARRRVQGAKATADSEEFKRKRELVDAFLTASRSGDFVKLLSVLDPDVVLRQDLAFPPVAAWPLVHGAEAVAKGFAGRAQGARPILINGSVGAVVAPRGNLLFVLEFKIVEGKITEIEMIAEQSRIRQLDVAEMKE